MAQNAFTNQEIGGLHVCDQPTGSTGLPDKNYGRPRQASGLAQNKLRYNFPICKCLLCHPGSSNPKKEAIFLTSIKFCISRCQDPKIEIFKKASSKMPPPRLNKLFWPKTRHENGKRIQYTTHTWRGAIPTFIIHFAVPPPFTSWVNIRNVFLKCLLSWTPRSCLFSCVRIITAIVGFVFVIVECPWEHALFVSLVSVLARTLLSHAN